MENETKFLLIYESSKYFGIHSYNKRGLPWGLYAREELRTNSRRDAIRKIKRFGKNLNKKVVKTSTNTLRKISRHEGHFGNAFELV